MTILPLTLMMVEIRLHCCLGLLANFRKLHKTQIKDELYPNIIKETILIRIIADYCQTSYIFTTTRVYMKSDPENLQKYNIPLKNVNKRELKLKLI